MVAHNGIWYFTKLDVEDYLSSRYADEKRLAKLVQYVKTNLFKCLRSYRIYGKIKITTTPVHGNRRSGGIVREFSLYPVIESYDVIDNYIADHYFVTQHYKGVLSQTEKELAINELKTLVKDYESLIDNNILTIHELESDPSGEQRRKQHRRSGTWCRSE